MRISDWSSDVCSSDLLLPQLEGTAEVVAHARTITGLTVAALVPNALCALDAIAAGAHLITLPLSIYETHNLRNLLRTHAQVLAEAAAIAPLIRNRPAHPRPQPTATLSPPFSPTLTTAPTD